MGSQAFGVIGLEVMGRNIALNVERNGYPIAVFNRTYSKTEALPDRPGQGQERQGGQDRGRVLRCWRSRGAS